MQARYAAGDAAARMRQVLGEGFESQAIAVEAAGALRLSGWVIRPWRRLPQAATASMCSSTVATYAIKLIVHALKEAYRDVLHHQLNWRIASSSTSRRTQWT